MKQWSGKRGSNPRPSAWKADALPTELLPPLHKPILDDNTLLLNIFLTLRKLKIDSFLFSFLSFLPEIRGQPNLFDTRESMKDEMNKG